jgi:hypothetical protein
LINLTPASASVTPVGTIHKEILNDTSGKARGRTLALRALATRTWDHAKTPGAKAMACGRDIALDMVQAVQAREMAARQAAIASFDRTLARAEAFAVALARDLDRCAALHVVMARELLQVSGV